MARDNAASSGGIGFPGILTVLFVGLKLGGVIDWSWWWVLSPIWISFLILAAFVALFLWAHSHETPTERLSRNLAERSKRDWK